MKTEVKSDSVRRLGIKEQEISIPNFSKPLKLKTHSR
jgi:hypothetical protein